MFSILLWLRQKMKKYFRPGGKYTEYWTLFVPFVLLDNAGQNSAGNNIISDWWNNHWTAKFIPDVLYVNMGSAATTSIGLGYSSGYALQIEERKVLVLDHTKQTQLNMEFMVQ